LAVFALASAPAASANGGGASAGGAGASSASGTSSTTPGSSPTATSTSGGAGVGAQPALPFPRPTVPGFTAKIIHGVAYAPANAPLAVQEAIWAGDRIRLKPYRVGGGHGVWNDSAYDCSGSVSYVLHAAGLLKVSEDSGEFMTWGRRGSGAWMTIYTNPGHAFVEIAGIRLDTSAEQYPNPPSGSGPRWRPLMTSTAGYVARHPLGL
jgi:cell wall-associated NlpC family hydrolase